MNPAIRPALGLLLVLSFACTARSATGNPCSVAPHLEAMLAAERAHIHSPSADRANAVIGAYEQLAEVAFSSSCRGHDLQALRTRLQAARMALVYRPSVRVQQDISHIVSLLSARNATLPSDVELLYDAAIGSRDFKSAEQIKQSHPLIRRPVPPRVIDDREPPAQGTAVYRLADMGNDLLQDALDVHSGRWMVIVASPSCAFSNRATAHFEASEALRRKLDGLGVSILWLQPVNTTMNIERAREWSKIHPRSHLYWARFQQDWPLLDNWDTPSFYLIEDGKLLGTRSGWPENGGADEVESLLLPLKSR